MGGIEMAAALIVAGAALFSATFSCRAICPCCNKRPRLPFSDGFYQLLEKQLLTETAH